MTNTNTLINLIQNSSCLSKEDKFLLLHSLDSLTPEENTTIQETLDNEEEIKNQIEGIYTDQKKSLFVRYIHFIKTIKLWAFHEGEEAERESEQNRLNTLLDS